jgi:hypothetical protein
MAGKDLVSNTGGLSFQTQKLAFGQRIGLITDNTSTQAIVDAIASLTQVKGDITDVLSALFGSGGGPSASWCYDPSVEWLVGLEITYGVLNFDVLLVDGKFYGLRIKIGEKPKNGKKNGKKNGDGGGDGVAGQDGQKDGNGNGNGNGEDKDPWANLELEILYRKVKPHLGEFSADLTLPKKYRTIKLEAAELTLPAVGIAIWTNGDFKVSIGWPLGDRSLSVIFPPDPIPWAGGGGLYFAKLRSDDAPNLGSDFGGIIEFGLALRVGAATDGEWGIVSYSASIYLFGTFQGFLAWRTEHSFSDGLDYYWFAATVGVQGSLSGQIDFKILSVSIDLTLTASAGLALETGHSSLVRFEFTAQVEASIKILFVKITFSYTLDIYKDFTFGSGPVTSLDGPSPPGSLSAAREALEAPAPLPPAPKWSIDDGAGVTVDAHLLLQPSVRYDTTTSTWKPVAIASVVVPRPQSAGGDDPFSKMVARLVSQVVATYGTGGTTAQEITAAGKALEAGRFDLQGVYDALKAGTISFTLAGATSSSSGDGSDTAAVLPMIPGVELTYAGTTTTFGDDPEPSGYDKLLTDYFAKLSLVGDGSVNGATVSAQPVPPSPSWFPGVLFHDAFNMLARQALSDLEDLAGKHPDETLPQLIALLDVGNLAGVLTRFLQHGLRVPDPAATDGPLRGLYELAGQQFDLADDAGHLITTGTIAVGASKVDVTISSADVELPVTLTQPPEASPLLTPRALDPLTATPSVAMLRQGYRWTQGTTTWQLFDLAEPLQAQLRLASPLKLALGVAGDPKETVVGTQALVIRFSLAPVPGSKNTFQVSGTDDATRDLMELLFASGSLATSEVDLLLPGATTGSYQTMAANAGATFVKTNLSSVGQPALTVLFDDLLHDRSAAPALGPVSAPLSDPTNFLRLLWECSVVHTSGFFLTVPDPSALTGAASYDVAVLVKPTSAPASPVTVEAYHTTILVETPPPGRLQAAIQDANGAAITVPQPNYPPGTLAFCASWGPQSSPPVPIEVEAADSGAYAAALYQLLQFSIREDDFLEGSGWSRPLGPGTPPDAPADQGTWYYRRAAPVQRYVKGQHDPPNRYAAIGHATTLDLQLVDVYGNAQALAPLEVTPYYNDRLVALDEWAGADATFAFAAAGSGEATLTITVAFDPTRVVQPDTASQQYALIVDQLTDPRVGVALTTSLAAEAVTTTGDLRVALATFATAVGAYLKAGKTGPVPAPAVVTGTVTTSYVEQIAVDMFPVWVSLETSRTAPGGSPSYPDDSILSVTSKLKPVGGAADSPAAALTTWAQSFEGAYADFDGHGALLKVLAGSPPTKVTATMSKLGATREGDVTSVPGDIWALRWSAQSGVGVAFPNTDAPTPPQAPVYFSPMPLARELVAGDVEVVPYDDAGNPGTPVSTGFAGVDLDVWAGSFLGAVDQLLTPEMATAMAAIGVGAPYAKLMDLKAQVADAIAGGVSWVFGDQMPRPDGHGGSTPGYGDLEVARTTFRESLLTSLGTDYTTSVIVQVPAHVSVRGPFATGESSRPPELFGTPSPAAGNAAQYTFTSASLPLVDGDGWLTYLADVVHPTQHSDLCLPFSYEVGFVDHSFETSEEQFGYVPSTWLRFVLPKLDPGDGKRAVLDVDMGTLDVPVPLRAFPSAPRLVSQAMTAMNPGSTALGDLVLATYSVTVGTPTVAQDVLHLTVLGNGAVLDRPDSPSSSPPALFAPLAQFQDFQLSHLETAREAIATGSKDAATWLAAIIDRVRAVADAWPTLPKAGLGVEAGEAQAPPPLPFTWSFALQIADETSAEITLSWTGDGQGPPPGAWPQINGVSPTGSDPLTRMYKLTAPLPDELSLSWPELSIVTHQKMTSAAWIDRNEKLGGACPGAPPHPNTNPDLVYSTATISFAEPIVPLLQVPQKLTLTSSSLADATSQLVGGIITPTQPDAQVGWGLETAYAFTLVPGEPPLDSRLPVFLARTSVSTAGSPPNAVDTIDGLAKKLAAQLDRWYEAQRPAPTSARLLFGLTLFAAGTDQAILRLDDIEAPIAASGWWPKMS